VIFALGVVAGLWVSAGVRRSQQESVDPRSTGFHGGGGGGICCRPEPNPDFEEFVAPTRLMHDMTDRELFWRATLVPTAAARYPFERVPKVAFMFLAGRGVLPLAPLWERFFRGAGHEERFSVYVHAPPGVAINVSADSPFYGRQIPSQVSDCRRTYAACMMSTTCSVNVSEDSRFVRLISCTSVLPAV
jgi:type IV secretory pathway protease TraF